MRLDREPGGDGVPMQPLSCLMVKVRSLGADVVRAQASAHAIFYSQ